MRTLLWIGALTAMVAFVATESAQARGKCGGGGGGRGGRHGGGCGGGCYGGGYGGGCYGGGCGGGGYAGGGCASGHCAVDHAGHAMAMADEAPSTLVVNLPADARLIVDDRPTTSTSNVRVFMTPPLPNGKEFHYTLRAEITRNGQTQSVTREVAVRAGEETQVTLAVPAMTVAAK